MARARIVARARIPRLSMTGARAAGVTRRGRARMTRGRAARVSRGRGWGMRRVIPLRDSARAAATVSSA